MQTKTFTVPGMHCGNCERAVKTELEAVPGVQRVAVALDAKLVTIEGEELDDGALRAAIDEAGYEVTG
jgi:copper chaperone